MNDYWKSHITDEPATITLESLRAGFDAIQARSLIVHGSEQDPHMCHPRTGLCICGRTFDVDQST